MREVRAGRAVPPPPGRGANCVKRGRLPHRWVWLGCSPQWEISSEQHRSSAKCCRKPAEAERRHFPWKLQLPGEARNAMGRMCSGS